jgi:4'-phosphopantetheinyl transferase
MRERSPLCSRAACLRRMRELHARRATIRVDRAEPAGVVLFARAPCGGHHTLAENEIHVWAVPLDRSDTMAECEALLDPAERDRATRFKSPADRVRFVRRRAALREIVAAYTGAAPRAIAFEQNAHGKPVLSASDLKLNTSHSDDVAVIALGRCETIGVDVERLRPHACDGGVAEHVFTLSERTSLADLEPAERVQRFFTFWTCKEAVVKALGRGLSVPLDSFEIALGRGGRPEIGRWDVPGAAAKRLELCCFEPVPGYVGALAFSAAAAASPAHG